MNSKFIRTFADDLSDMAKKYRKDDPILVSYIERAVINLHAIARLIEEKEHVGENNEDTGNTDFPNRRR